MKFCEKCSIKETTARSKLCLECQKIEDKKRKLKSYHKNKHKYTHQLKGTDEKSRDQRRRSYHKNKHKCTYMSIIVNKIFKGVKSRAKKLGRDFDLTKKFLEDLYKKQNEKCALTNIPFNDEKYGCMRRPFAPSLDRIDSKKGYTQNNVRFVCTIVNMSLNEFGDAIFAKMCEAYVENTIRRQQ